MFATKINKQDLSGAWRWYVSKYAHVCGSVLDETLRTTLAMMLSQEKLDALSVGSGAIDHFTKDIMEAYLEEALDDKKTRNNRLLWVRAREFDLGDPAFGVLEAAGFKEQKKVSAFFAPRGFAARCFTRVVDGKMDSFVFTPKLSLEQFHILQVGLPVFLPGMFDGGLSDWQKRVVEALQKVTPDEYMRLIEEFSERSGLREKFIAEALGGLGAKRAKRHADDVSAHIASIMTEIREYYLAISRDTDEVEKLKAQLRGYMLGVEDGVDSELVQYMQKSKCVDLSEVTDDGEVKFWVKSPLTYYDEEYVRKMVESPTSALYAGGRPDSIACRENMKKLYQKLFVDREFVLNFCAFFTMDQYGVSVARGLTPPEWLGDYMPNPHLDRYGCFGNRRERLMHEAADKGDYVTVVEQLIASTKQFSFDDPSPLAHLVSDLVSNRYRCISLPDGRTEGAWGAIDYILKEEAAKNEQGNSSN